jgi:TPP-dependent pyruvate/acetoin dehydrogenase alpha subunit
MKIEYTSQDLRDFETEIGECFNNKEIRAPIHLSDGSEDSMINIFKSVNPEDWVFCSWRSHYQCLLKGVPREELKADIIAGRSIALCYPKYNIMSSAIVTGVIPIANGVAFDIKRKNLKQHVYCFVGDMTSETGCFHENYKYSIQHNLPITWVIEDNNLSVCTDTRLTWKLDKLTHEGLDKIIYYQYKSKYPHAGSGSRIQF